MNGYGSIWLLEQPPWLVFLACILGSTVGVLLIRFIRTGKIEDKARSSVPGDIFLVMYIAVMAHAYQNSLPHKLLAFSPQWHNLIAGIAIVIANSLHAAGLVSRKSHKWTMHAEQWYHNVIVVPLLAYIIGSTSPLLFRFRMECLLERVVAAMCLLVWLGLLIGDFCHGNLVQEESQ